ncbi:MAG TPA: hypothetical protein VM115_00245 [Vicinamibacterales bacterium]|nr:hypothetical protein [Vicinamibacterales bacterium]
MKAKLDGQIDEMYKLPLDAFTKSRNTLAKTLSGNDKQAVASLVKPSVAMWVVNQLYWQDPSTYTALVDASEKSRAAHRAALSGRATDTRKADEMHKTTLEKAFAKANALAQKKGVALTDAVRDAVRRTLAAVPTDETPGRMTREPAAVGFSLLTGIEPPPAAVTKRRESEKEKEHRRKQAEAEAKKAEEKARKEQEKRDREIEKAEQALRNAERRLAKLKG